MSLKSGSNGQNGGTRQILIMAYMDPVGLFPQYVLKAISVCGSQNS